MPDKKITQLDPIPAVADADLLAIVDNTDTTTKKVTAAQFKEHVKVVGVKDEFTATPGQTAFALSAIPSGDAALIVLLNGKGQLSTKYSFTGTSFTWGNVPVLLAGDTLIMKYNSEAPVFGLYKGTYAGTMPVGGANLTVTAAQLGLTDARQIVMSELTAKGIDQNWWKSGNSFAATHAFSYSIPTGTDPNVGDMVIQVPAGSTTILGQPFEFIYLYQSTNFLS